MGSHATTRAVTRVEDGTVYVQAGERRVAVGDLDAIVELVGGPAWTISYTEREKRRRPDLDTSDEGLTVDVTDTVRAMTFEAEFVASLAAKPAEPVGEDSVSPRLGLFAGRLLGNLEYGVQ